MQIQQAIVAAPGGPDVIQWHSVDLPPLKSGEVRVRHQAVGVNYIDTYHRDGTYPMRMPTGLGREAAGVITDIGPDVTGFAVGDAVASFAYAGGSYASGANLPANTLFKLPASISPDIAAASLLKACTTEALVDRCAKVQAGWTVLVHAAAGGVGLIMVQWLKAIGAVMIGTVSTLEKAAAAKAAGCDHVILYRDEDVAARVREITHGKGVPVVFDGIGRATWDISLKSLARRGLLVSYGNAGGVVTGVNLGSLAAHGSLFVTRPSFFDYYLEPDDRALGSARVFDMIGSGKVQIHINHRYALTDAAQAHADLEAGRTSGSIILVP
ncbi:quinone oxidoreductase family protein [Sphingopyxis yananensis]|uniref:quinone oxidoreductase family protein n=1 Tax=Sphingopyxis yananensis TaxID=2886687 RepID=UPI001D10DB2E|nr:quinone oxidoreductase [Sphingopyxis yananensis]MCC2602598.1 quinone oxidoreductase [Sphingopyxis yananensis]